MNHIVKKAFRKKKNLWDIFVRQLFQPADIFFMYENKIVYDLMLMLLSDVGNEGGRVNTELSVPEEKDDEHEVFLYMFNSGIAKNLMRHGYIFHHYTDDDEFYSIPVEIIGEVLSEVDEKGKTPA